MRAFVPMLNPKAACFFYGNVNIKLGLEVIERGGKDGGEILYYHIHIVTRFNA